MTSLKEDWISIFSFNMNSKGGFPDVVKYESDKGLFALWERKVAPGSADRYLANAIDIACGDYEHPYVNLFLDWAIAHCERALADPRFSNESDNQLIGWRNDLYLTKHGLTLEILAIATAMRKNESLNQNMLTQAIQEKSQYDLSCGHWSYMEQFSYLACVHYALIIGSIDLALELLKTRKNFKQVHRHYDWLSNFVKAVNVNAMIEDPLVIKQFQQYFDEIRAPDFKSSGDTKSGKAIFCSLPLLRVQFALLKHKYIYGRDIENDWQSVIDHINE